jgi:hypothetical protein
MKTLSKHTESVSRMETSTLLSAQQWAEQTFGEVQ